MLASGTHDSGMRTVDKSARTNTALTDPDLHRGNEVDKVEDAVDPLQEYPEGLAKKDDQAFSVMVLTGA